MDNSPVGTMGLFFFLFMAKKKERYTMEQEKKCAVLLTQDGNGQISKREITQEELGWIFFQEGNREWDQVHIVLPDPVWEKLYDNDGVLVYEGYTLDHKAYGAGRAFFRDGTVSNEGIFGIKGFMSGRTFYSNGIIQFDGLFRLNQAYGPNYPEYGIWYDRNGKMLYRGKFSVSRSSLGWPRVYEPEGFGTIPNNARLKGKVFMWEDARKLMKRKDDRHETDKR